MSRLKALAKESMVYGVSSLLSRFLNFLLVPFYTHVLTPAEFGVSNILFALIAFLNILYQAGFDSSYLRLEHDADDAGRKRLFSTAFWSQAGIAALLTVPFMLTSPWLGSAFAVPDRHLNLFGLAALILALDTLTVVPMAHLRARHQALPFAVIRLANVAVNIGANLVFVLWLKQGLWGVLLANAVASLLTVLLLLPTLIAHLTLNCDRGAFSSLLRFGLPFIPAGLYGIVNEMAGRLFLSRLSPADVERLYPGTGWDMLHLTGIFSASWKLGIFGHLLVQMYRLAWQPFFLQHQGAPDAQVLFGRVLRLLLLFVGVCCLGLMLFLDKLVSFPILGKTLIAPAFWAGLPIVPGVLLAYAFQAWFVHFTLGVYIAKKTRALIWINGLGAAVTVILNLWWVPRMGLWGAVWAAVACYAVMAFFMTRQSQGLYPIDMNWKCLLPTVAWLSACFAAGFWVQAHPELPLWPRLGLLTAGLLLPFALGAITSEERRIFLGLSPRPRNG